MTSRKSKRSRHDERVSGSRDSRESEIERKEEAFDASSYVDAHFVYGIFYSNLNLFSGGKKCSRNVKEIATFLRINRTIYTAWIAKKWIQYISCV